MDPARNDFWELAGGLPVNARSRGSSRSCDVLGPYTPVDPFRVVQRNRALFFHVRED